MQNDNDKNNTATDAAKTATGGENGPGNDKTHEEQKNAKEAVKGIYTHKFNKPFEHDGKKHVTIDFNFGKLTGHDMVIVEQELQDDGNYVIASEVSKTFQCKLAARAAGIGSDVIMDMPLPDFNKITNEARAFLLNTGY